MESVPKIKELFETDVKERERDISDLATACAVAIFKIEGDTAYVDRLLQHISHFEVAGKLNKYFDYKCQKILQDIIVPSSRLS